MIEPDKLAAHLISIHALREESDFLPSFYRRKIHHFNPRPPRGERPPDNINDPAVSLFQSTPSARRATAMRCRPWPSLLLFQSTPSARRATAHIHILGWQALYFNPRPPRGERPSERKAG